MTLPGSNFIPTISVVIPVYNGEQTIGRCLDSLLNQQYPSGSFDIIVVENGSTDNTNEVVSSYPVRLMHSSIRGVPEARNVGITASQADIIAFTDADCIADPYWLAELVRPYEKPEVGGVGGTILAYEHREQSAIEKFSANFSPLVNFWSGEGEFLPHLYTANASYRRSLLEEVGGFNTQLITADDVDLAWRIQLETGCQIAFAPESVIYHHHRSTLNGLAKQYRQYGFGEILLDTLYGKYPGYPRNRRYQVKRMAGQIVALPRYGMSYLLRWMRQLAGKNQDTTTPKLWFMIESKNLQGKMEGLITTRFMSDARSTFKSSNNALHARFFQHKKE